MIPVRSSYIDDANVEENNIDDIYKTDEEDKPKPVLPRIKTTLTKKGENYEYDEDDETDPNTIAPGPREPTPFTIIASTSWPNIIYISSDSEDESPQKGKRTGGKPERTMCKTRETTPYPNKRLTPVPELEITEQHLRIQIDNNRDSRFDRGYTRFLRETKTTLDMNRLTRLHTNDPRMHDRLAAYTQFRVLE